MKRYIRFVIVLCLYLAGQSYIQMLESLETMTPLQCSLQFSLTLLMPLLLLLVISDCLTALVQRPIWEVIALAILKARLKYQYIQYSQVRNEYNCGNELAAYMSSRIRHQRKQINRYISGINQLDPSANLKPIDE